ncbi:hypothetical protein L7F22_038509 [Adiantum nelumboides]|nr:hypothetical protein [Adiantum nelumboides]
MTIWPCPFDDVRLQASELRQADFKGAKWIMLDGYGLYGEELVERIMDLAKQEDVQVAMNLFSFKIIFNDYAEDFFDKELSRYNLPSPEEIFVLTSSIAMHATSVNIRISVLEAAAIDRDTMIEKQRRKICAMKSQLGGVNKRFGKEISILRNQSEQMQNRFSTVTGVSEKKILELKEELQHSESKTKLLENQLGFIYKCIEDPLEMFNLTELHESAPESVQQSSNMRSSRRSCKKQEVSEADEITEGFDDFTTLKEDRQLVAKDVTGSSLMKKRQAKNSMAGKILQLRSENIFLSKQVGQRNDRLKSLFHEAEHLRKQLKDAVAARNSALCQVRESERLFEKLEAMEPLIYKAGILNEQDLACTYDDFPADKGHKLVDLESKGRSKDGTMTEAGGQNNADGICVNFVRFPRKQSFKKWAIILSKIRSALLVFVSKVHATSQLESSLKMEKDSFNSLIQRLQREVLSELDSKSLESMVEMERLQGEDQIELGKDMENHTRTVKVDKELVHKILTAVRAQKKKLFVTTGRIEDLKKEKISSEANLYNKQKKLSELEKRFAVLETDKQIFFALIRSLHSMLIHIDCPSVSKGSEKSLMVSKASSYMDSGLDSLTTQPLEAADAETVIKKLESVLDEREELKGKITEIRTQNMKLCDELANLHNAVRLLGVSDHDVLAGNEDLPLQIKQFKARKDELEIFYEESVSWHRSITKNLQILQAILIEGMVCDDKELLELDYVISKESGKSLLQESFKQVACCIPDMVLKVNILSLDHKEFDSKLRKAELRRKEVESELSKQSQVLDVSTGLQKELDEANKILREIYSSVSSDSIESIETESIRPNILEKVHRMVGSMQEINKESAERKQKVEALNGEMFSAQEVLLEALVLVKSLRQDVSNEVSEESELDARKNIQIENHKNISENERGKGSRGELESSFITLFSQLKTHLEEVQSFRKTENMRVSNEVSKLKQELEKANEQLEKHVKHSVNASTDYNEKMQAISEEVASMKAERESLLSEVSASSAQIYDLQRALRELERHGNTQIGALQGEKEGLTAELKKVNLQNQEQALLYEQSKKELADTVEGLRTELSYSKSEHSGSKDTAEELRRMIVEGQDVHKQALKDWEIKQQLLEEESRKLQHELNQLVAELQTLKSKLKEKELMNESMAKAGLQQAEAFRLELARASHEQAGSGDEISKLHTLLKERDLAAAEAGSQLSQCNKRIENLSKETMDLQQEKSRFEKQLIQSQKAINDNDFLHKSKLNALTAEVYRLGGCDVTEDNEKFRRQSAAERVLNDF